MQGLKAGDVQATNGSAGSRDNCGRGLMGWPYKALEF